MFIKVLHISMTNFKSNHRYKMNH